MQHENLEASQHTQRSPQGSAPKASSPGPGRSEAPTHQTAWNVYVAALPGDRGADPEALEEERGDAATDKQGDTPAPLDAQTGAIVPYMSPEQIFEKARMAALRDEIAALKAESADLPEVEVKEGAQPTDDAQMDQTEEDPASHSEMTGDPKELIRQNEAVALGEAAVHAVINTPVDAADHKTGDKSDDVSDASDTESVASDDSDLTSVDADSEASDPGDVDPAAAASSADTADGAKAKGGLMDPVLDQGENAISTVAQPLGIGKRIAGMEAEWDPSARAANIAADQDQPTVFDSDVVDAGAMIGNVCLGIGAVSAAITTTRAVRDRRVAKEKLGDATATDAEHRTARKQVNAAELDIFQGGGSMGTTASYGGAKIIGEASEIATSALGGAGGGLVAGLGTISAARSARNAARSGQRKRDLQHLELTDERMKQIRDYIAKKNARREVRGGVAAAGSLLGAGGGVAGTVAIAAGGAAVMATPVGWALFAGGATVSLGMSAYKVGRWAYKKRRASRGKHDPSKKAKIAQELQQAVIADHPEAMAIVKSMGFSGGDIDLIKGRGGDAMIKDKLKSW